MENFDAAAEAIFKFFFYAAIIYLLIMIFICLSATFLYIVFYFIRALPYFIMGKKAGFRHEWISFIPTGYNYIAFTLPHRKFRLGFLHTHNRKLVFWIWLFSLIVAYIISFCIAYYIFMMQEGQFINQFMYSFLISPLSYIVNAAFGWRKNYDLLKTYGLNKHAIWAPTVNIICPIVMIVFSYIIMRREPEYKFDGYYYGKWFS